MRETADAKSKLMELESKYQSMKDRSTEDQAAYRIQLGAARNRITELEESLRKSKESVEVFAQSAVEVSDTECVS